MRVSRVAVLALAFLGCAISADADDFNRDVRNAPAAQAPHRRPHPGRDAASTTDEVRTPRYMVEQISFYADDESGDTDWGSDEIISNVFTANYMLASHEFGDVDTHETRTFPAYERCIYPAYDPDGDRNGHWACHPEGAAGPINFTIGLRESDVEIFPSGTCLYSGTDMLGDRCDLHLSSSNDLGVYVVHMSEAQLLAAMPHEGDTFERRLSIGDGCARSEDNAIICQRGDTDDASYVITVRFTRVADDVQRVPRAVTTR
ncbi:MAG: hypothetical protein KF779_11845 [Hyphomonadaceae bacterium]|nr:hypothetical protein [Hyphomonadaceae bacterium]